MKIKIKPGQRWIYSNKKRHNWTVGKWLTEIERVEKPFIHMNFILKNNFLCSEQLFEIEGNMHKSYNKTSPWHILKNQDKVNEI